MNNRWTILPVLMLAAFLAGCGRGGQPEKPPGATYPQHYPNLRLSPQSQGAPAGTEAVFVDPSVRRSHEVQIPQSSTSAFDAAPSGLISSVPSFSDSPSQETAQ